MYCYRATPKRRPTRNVQSADAVRKFDIFSLLVLVSFVFVTSSIILLFRKPSEVLARFVRLVPNFQQEISGVLGLHAPIDAESVLQSLVHAVDPTQLSGEQYVCCGLDNNRRA